jgi:plastocyanin
MKSIISAIVVCGVMLLAQAANFQVTVGADGLVYSPDTVEAVSGDTVEFIVTGVHIHLFVLCGMKLISRNRLIVSQKLLLMHHVNL